MFTGPVFECHIASHLFRKIVDLLLKVPIGAVISDLDPFPVKPHDIWVEDESNVLAVLLINHDPRPAGPYAASIRL